MMISIENVNMPLDYGLDDLYNKCAKMINIKKSDILNLKILKKSIDARKKDNLCFVLKICLELRKNTKYNRKMAHEYIEKRFIIPQVPLGRKIIVVGSGPAGLFSALALALSGNKPIVIERGADVDNRVKAIDDYFNKGIFNEKTNTIFGEGGAGTFSDGKLTTNLNDPLINFILSEFVAAGANEEILYQAKPHIGTDVLVNVIKNIRKKIISLGGEFRFNSTFYDIIIENNKITGVKISGDNDYIEKCDDLILALGHSARDTIEMLYKKGVIMMQKAFSMGVRIEHKREMIDESQYGSFKDSPYLGAASYKLSTHLENGRGVYTFCMCPGGKVIPANSNKESICVNGMSYHARDLENSNSAVLVDVRPSDFGSDNPLAGLFFQEKYERLAYELNHSYKAPVQLVGDFLKHQKSIAIGSVVPSYPLGYILSELHGILPDFVSDSLKQGILAFDKKINGFAANDAVLTGIETRSSSPVRLLRDDNYMCNISNIYPIGEGAGYAGGITSAALDGLHCALKILGMDVGK